MLPNAMAPGCCGAQCPFPSQPTGNTTSPFPLPLGCVCRYSEAPPWCPSPVMLCSPPALHGWKRSPLGSCSKTTKELELPSPADVPAPTLLYPSGRPCPARASPTPATGPQRAVRVSQSRPPCWCHSRFPVAHLVLFNLPEHLSSGTGCPVPRAGTTGDTGDAVLGCPREQPILEALFPCAGTETCHPAGTETRHPPGSVGIAVTASRSSTSSGCGSAHRHTLMGLGKRGQDEQSWKHCWPESQQTLCIALLNKRLNGNNFYLL